MKVRKFRILRLRHHVSMVELGRACGVSAQRISELELSENRPSAETVQQRKSKATVKQSSPSAEKNLIRCIKNILLAKTV